MSLALHIGPMACTRCGGAMRLVRAVPRLGGFPELRVFMCASCGDVETLEAQEMSEAQGSARLGERRLER